MGVGVCEFECVFFVERNGNETMSAAVITAPLLSHNVVPTKQMKNQVILFVIKFITKEIPLLR